MIRSEAVPSLDVDPAPSLDAVRPAEPEAPVRAERAAFARLAEAERFERREHGDRVRVVDHAQVDVGVSDAGAREGERPRLPGGDVEQVALADAVMAHRLGRAEDARRLLPEVAGALERGQHQCTAPVGDHAAVEKMERRRDHARREHVVDGDRLPVERGGRIGARAHALVGRDLGPPTLVPAVQLVVALRVHRVPAVLRHVAVGHVELGLRRTPLDARRAVGGAIAQVAGHGQ